MKQNHFNPKPVRGATNLLAQTDSVSRAQCETRGERLSRALEENRERLRLVALLLRDHNESGCLQCYTGSRCAWWYESTKKRDHFQTAVADLERLLVPVRQTATKPLPEGWDPGRRVHRPPHGAAPDVRVELLSALTGARRRWFASRGQAHSAVEFGAVGAIEDLWRRLFGGEPPDTLLEPARVFRVGGRCIKSVCPGPIDCRTLEGRSYTDLEHWPPVHGGCECYVEEAR